MAAVLGTLSVNLLMFLRFFFPRALYEPKTKFTIGYPGDFGFGVDTKFQKDHRIWVVRNTEGFSSSPPSARTWDARPIGNPARTSSSARVMAAATTPKASISRVRRRGPWTARTWNSIPQGQILVDLSHLYSWPKGERSQFGDDGAILRNV
jgi:hypothetical protein